jgi:hypothetical protein
MRHPGGGVENSSLHIFYSMVANGYRATAILRKVDSQSLIDSHVHSYRGRVCELKVSRLSVPSFYNKGKQSLLSSN